MRRPGAGQARRSGFRGIGGALAGYTYSPAESASILPLTAIWISTQGITQAGTVSDWASYLGGVSCTATQATGASQPAYSASGGVGGRPLVTFDGSDDVLEGTLTRGSSFDSFEMGVVGSRVAPGAAGDCWILYHIAGGFIAGIRDLATTTIWRGSSMAVDVNGTSNPTSSIAHWSWDGQTGDYVLRKNGTSEGTSSGSFTTSADGGTCAIGGRVAASAYANIAIQACYMGARLTTPQRSYLRSLLTYHTGISS